MTVKLTKKMAQPVKKLNNVKTKKRSEKRGPRKDDLIDDNVKRLPSNADTKRRRKWNPFKGKSKNHPAYGTSKLEVRFQKEFLDKLGLKYIYQYKMESIGRYLDFMIVDNVERPSFMVALEVDGVFYHGKGLVYEEMSPMQKRNCRVDKIKNEWCARNGIPLIRIWEDDINKKPYKVLKWLEEKLKPFIDGTYENKRKRHNKSSERDMEKEKDKENESDIIHKDNRDR